MTTLSQPRFRLLVFGLVLMLTVFVLRRLAHADTGPAAPASGLDLTAALALVGAVTGGIGLILGGLSAVLHAIAPRTKTTVDDTLAADLDAAHVKLDQLLALIRPPVPTIVPGSAADLADQMKRGVAKFVGPPTGTLPLLALLLLCLGASQLGCATVKSGAVAAKAATIDCVHADQAPIVALLVQLGVDAVTAALNGTVDWGALAQEAEHQGAVVGGCAFAQLAGHPWPAPPTTGVAVSALMTPPPAPDPRAAALERLRAGFGGVRWQTAAGVL